MIKTPSKKDLKLDMGVRAERAARALFGEASDGSATSEQIVEAAALWDASVCGVYGWYFELCEAHAESEAE